MKSVISSETVRDIIASFKTIGLALLWGSLLGLSALGFSIIPLNTTFIFGGLGMWVAYKLKIVLLLPLIHCIYSYLIIRFRLKGVVSVVLVHYTSIVVALITWTTFHMSPDIWDGVRMCYDAFINPHPIYNEPLYKVLGPISVMGTIVPSVAYNGFLLSLLFAKIRKKLSL